MASLRLHYKNIKAVIFKMSVFYTNQMKSCNGNTRKEIETNPGKTISIPCNQLGVDQIR